MATEAQVVANRLNAQKSTGPRTDAGKAVVAQNAVRHGLLAHQVVIRGEDPGQFESYRDEMLSELAPAGATESMLAERVVHLAWRLRRAERIQAEVFDAMLVRDAAKSLEELARSLRPNRADERRDNPADGASPLGMVVVKDFTNYRVLDRLGLYERRIEHSLYRTMSEFRKLRLLREVDEPTHSARGILKSGGPGEGGTASEGNHRPSFDRLRRGTALAAGTPSPPVPAVPAGQDQLRQTNPIAPLSGRKTGFAGQSKANQSQFGGVGRERTNPGRDYAAGLALDVADSANRLEGNGWSI